MDKWPPSSEPADERRSYVSFWTFLIRCHRDGNAGRDRSLAGCDRVRPRRHRADRESAVPTTLGYTLEEVKGKPHSLFVEPAYAVSAEYKQFWAELRAGEYQASQFKRIGKGGKEVWIEAIYNPVIGRDGKPTKVVKFATDVTARRKEFADMSGQIAAINIASCDCVRS
jgi:PAS domain S-box-containing protein